MRKLIFVLTILMLSYVVVAGQVRQLHQPQNSLQSILAHMATVDPAVDSIYNVLYPYTYSTIHDTSAIFEVTYYSYPLVTSWDTAHDTTQGVRAEYGMSNAGRNGYVFAGGEKYQIYRHFVRMIIPELPDSIELVNGSLNVYVETASFKQRDTYLLSSWFTTRAGVNSGYDYQRYGGNILGVMDASTSSGSWSSVELTAAGLDTISAYSGDTLCVVLVNADDYNDSPTLSVGQSSYNVLGFSDDGYEPYISVTYRKRENNTNTLIQSLGDSAAVLRAIVRASQDTLEDVSSTLNALDTDLDVSNLARISATDSILNTLGGTISRDTLSSSIYVLAESYGIGTGSPEDPADYDSVLTAMRNKPYSYRIDLGGYLSQIAVGSRWSDRGLGWERMDP